MNDKFFTLSKERQHRMLNAGYQIFASLDIKRIKSGYMHNETTDILSFIDRSPFKDPEAVEKLLKLITMAVEGFMTVNKQAVFNDPQKAMQEMEQLLLSLRDNYYKTEKLEQKTGVSIH